MKFGTDLADNSDFEMNLSVYLRTNTFLQGMTGSGKTGLILNMLEATKSERPDVQNIFIEDQEEFTDIPKLYGDIKYISMETTPKMFTVQHAKQIGVKIRKIGLSVVVNLHDFEKRSDRCEFMAEFLKGFGSLGKKVGTPAKIYIDEADQYCPRIDKKVSRNSKEQIIDIAKRGRKFNITLVVATQRASSVDIEVRAECPNRIVGKTTESRDRTTAKEIIGLTNEEKEELYDFTAGNFYVRGEMFKKGVSRIYVPESSITRKQAGVSEDSEIDDDNIVDKIFLKFQKENPDAICDYSGKYNFVKKCIGDNIPEMTENTIEEDERSLS